MTYHGPKGPQGPKKARKVARDSYAATPTPGATAPPPARASRPSTTSGSAQPPVQPPTHTQPYIPLPPSGPPTGSDRWKVWAAVAAVAVLIVGVIGVVGWSSKQDERERSNQAQQEQFAAELEKVKKERDQLREDAKRQLDEAEKAQKQAEEERRQRVAEDPDAGDSQSEDPKHNVVSPTAPPDENSPIYHKSVGWEWLERPNLLVPGAQYANDTQGSVCSTGFFVHIGDRQFILTAGHCAAEGDVIAMTDSAGTYRYVGEMVESTYTQVGEVDYGLIDLSDNTTGSVMCNQNPCAAWKSTMPFEFDMRIAGAASTDWLKEHRPRLCRLGFKTGLSCGKFIAVEGESVVYENISDRGDSGGPVFTESDGKLLAVGLTSGVWDEDKTTATAQLVEPLVKRWGLTLYQ